MAIDTEHRAGPTPDGEAAGHTGARRKGRVLRFFGKTFLAAAFVLAAYLVWLLWGTGLYTAQEQDLLRNGIRDRIIVAESGPRTRPGKALPGDAYAILKIPSIGVNAAVVQGTDLEGLRKGPGHYLKTADPWDDRGAVGIAGHRTTYGAPFWSLDELDQNDRIRLLTDRGAFTYRVTKLEVVAPTATEVLRPTDEPTLVLTTCHPRFSAAQRLVAFADRVEGEPRRVTERQIGGGDGGGPVQQEADRPILMLLFVGIAGGGVATTLGAGTAVARRVRRNP